MKQQTKPRLVSHAPIKNSDGSFGVEYINSDNKIQVLKWWDKEEAEHFIIMFDSHHVKPFLNTIVELNSDKAFEEKVKEAFTKVHAGNIHVEYNTLKSQPVTPAEEFTMITSSICEVLKEKNKRYGNSALNPIKVFNGKSEVGQRADDKISRIQNSEVLRKNDVCDLIGYLVLMCKENKWLNFSDQID